MNMTNPTKLSIIVPVYNCERFLDKCIKSLINQTIKDIEIILVNDGSKDDSLAICEKFAQQDNRIKVFTQENSGQATARNVGLNNANGEYIAFADSDDWIDEDYYEKLILSAQKYNADVACASIIRERRHTKKYRILYKEEKEYTNPQEKIDIAKCPDMCYVWNKVYKTSFINSINLRFVDGQFCEDIDFVCRAVYFSNKIITVPNTFYHYWVNTNSTVKTMMKSDKKRADYIIAKGNMIKFFKEHKLKTKPYNLIKEKHWIKFLGITILKIYIWETKKQYLLFGFIPILEEYIYA